MRLGLIARADNSGLGVQCWEFYRALQPEGVLVIDVGHLHNSTTHTNKRTFLERYPNPIVSHGWLPDRQVLKSFLSGLDVVFSAETFYSPEFASLAHRYNVKTVLQCNPEFLNRRDMPDLWAPPTEWMWDTIPSPKTLLPVPIATDRFVYDGLARPGCSSKQSRAGSHPGCRFESGHPGQVNFLHIVGRPAHLDRNGTELLLKALAFVESEILVTVKCQQPGYVSGLITEHSIRTPPNVTLQVDSSDVDHYWDNYEGDVLVMPRRFGGLCLPVNEALGAGMPTIMPAVSPNDSWLPAEWLVPASRQGAFMAKQRIDLYAVTPQQLAAKIDQFTEPEFYAKAAVKARELATSMSWATLKPKYQQILTEGV